MRKWSFVALLLVGAMVLGSTVLHEPIANAAKDVGTTIVGPLDANGNVKVHEQGTATVKSGDQTQLVFNDRLVDPGATLDVSAFKEIRVMLSCEPRGIGRSVGLQIYTVTGQSDVLLDAINQSCPSMTTRTYELPGTSIRMTNFNIEGKPEPVDVAIFGRSN